MGMLIQLGIYAALIGGAWLAIHSFLGGYEAKGAAKQMAADKVVLEQVKTERDTAVSANVRLQLDVKRNAGETLACNQRVNDILTHGQTAKAAKDAALKAAGPRINSLSNQIAQLETALIASKQKPEVSCEKALAKAGEAIVPVAAGRLRDDSTGSSGGVGGKTSAPVNPGSHALRRAP